MKQKEYYQFLQLAIPLFSYLALVQIWEQYNYIQMRNYYTLVHIMLSCEVMYEGGNLAASKIRNLECPNYEICLIDYGCGKFNRKIHIMEQYP